MSWARACLRVCDRLIFFFGSVAVAVVVVGGRYTTTLLTKNYLFIVIQHSYVHHQCVCRWLQSTKYTKCKYTNGTNERFERKKYFFFFHFRIHSFICVIASVSFAFAFAWRYSDRVRQRRISVSTTKYNFVNHILKVESCKLASSLTEKIKTEKNDRKTIKKFAWRPFVLHIND